MEKIYILLPVFNRRETTRRFIECLRSQSYRNYYLVLIDDGSTDGTEDMVRAEIEAITVIKGRGHWWWAGSLQQGYDWLRSNASDPSDVVLIMNDDAEFESNFFEKALGVMRSSKRPLLFAQCYSKDTKLLVDSGFHVDWRRFRFEQAERLEDVHCFSSTALFIRLSDFLNLGGFHPKLLPHYGSDMEFTWRARQKGMHLMTDPSVRVWWDDKATGRYQFAGEAFPAFLKKFFSKRSVLNPVMWTMFVALSCPWRWKAVNCLRIWAGAAWQIGQYLVQKRTGPQ